MHVAVDRITGGASEGFLFDCGVLCGGAEFPVHITIRSPLEREARWLAKSLRAMDLGLIRLGSSKAVGAIAVRQVAAHGPHQDVFASFTHSEAS
jgi:hypothetical protein